MTAKGKRCGCVTPLMTLDSKLQFCLCTSEGKVPCIFSVFLLMYIIDGRNHYLRIYSILHQMV